MTTSPTGYSGPSSAPAIRSTAALGRVLRRERQARGLTQADLAKASGATRQAVLNLEAGHETQALRTLFDLLATLGVELTTRDRSRHGS